MPIVSEYLLKLSASLMVVYLFYILVLRRLTFYTWNRLYLIGYSMLSLLMPFIDITPVLQENDWNEHALMHLVPAIGAQVIVPEVNQNLTWRESGWWLPGAVLFTGMTVMGIRFLIRYYSLVRMKKKASLLVKDDISIYQVDQAIIPFSFGKSIFINNRLHTEKELQQIIAHEFVHVRQRHTIDLLWCELLCIVNWYNPFAWLIRKAVRQNLEFIADNEVLQNGVDKKQYQYLLLRVTDAARFTITNHFNFTSLKKRIVMMNRSRSAKIQLGRFLFVLPLMAVLMLAFRSSVSDKQHPVSKPDQVSVPASIPVPAIVQAPTDTVPAPQKHAPVKEKKPGSPEPSVVPEKPVRARPGNGVGKAIPANVLVIIDGEEMEDGNKALEKIAPNEIETINVLKGEKAIELYGEKGKNGVIEIKTTTGRGVERFSYLSAGKDTLMLPHNKMTGPISFRIGSANQALYIVDGVEYTQEECLKLNIGPNSIEKIDVLQTGEAIYGPRGKNGVVIITLKKNKE